LLEYNNTRRCQLSNSFFLVGITKITLTIETIDIKIQTKTLHKKLQNLYHQ